MSQLAALSSLGPAWRSMVTSSARARPTSGCRGSRGPRPARVSTVTAGYGDRHVERRAGLPPGRAVRRHLASRLGRPLRAFPGLAAAHAALRRVLAGRERTGPVHVGERQRRASHSPGRPDRVRRGPRERPGRGPRRGQRRRSVPRRTGCSSTPSGSAASGSAPATAQTSGWPSTAHPGSRSSSARSTRPRGGPPDSCRGRLRHGRPRYPASKRRVPPRDNRDRHERQGNWQ